MFISKFEGAFCYPFTVPNDGMADMVCRDLYYGGMSKCVVFSQFAGGIIGDKQGPFLFSGGASKANFTFTEGATVYVYPCYALYDDKVALGYRKVETLIDYGSNFVACHHYVTFHMDTFQVVGTNDRALDAIALADSHPRYQNVLTKYWVNAGSGSIIGCPVWALPRIDSMLHVFRKGNDNFVSSAPMAHQALAKIRDMFGFGADAKLELVIGEEMCV